ncbi:MAG: S24/S26 family peptidase [Clostridiales bacterium]|nr:S24/S26 family peptidase [Clostridiales bacterium]
MITTSYKDELARSGKIIFTVKGVSMRPLFRASTDAIFVVSCVPDSLKNLDIVLFLRPGPNGIQYVLHRIVRRRADGMYLIAGDNCTDYDVVAPSDILGVVTSAKRGDKEIALSGFGYWLYKYLWCAPYGLRFFVLKVYHKIRHLGSVILHGRRK